MGNWIVDGHGVVVLFVVVNLQITPFDLKAFLISCFWPSPDHTKHALAGPSL